MPISKANMILCFVTSRGIKLWACNKRGRNSLGIKVNEMARNVGTLQESLSKNNCWPLLDDSTWPWVEKKLPNAMCSSVSKYTLNSVPVVSPWKIYRILLNFAERFAKTFNKERLSEFIRRVFNKLLESNSTKWLSHVSSFDKTINFIQIFSFLV